LMSADGIGFKTVHQTCGEVGSIALSFAFLRAMEEQFDDGAPRKSR
jgi:hypothetical protein